MKNQASKAACLKKKKILLLDDNAGAQQWLAMAATIAFGHNIEVTLATTLEAAEHNLKHCSFDLLIVDLNLSNGMGREALLHARKLYPNLASSIATIFSNDAHFFPTPALRSGALKQQSKGCIAKILNVNDNNPVDVSAATAQCIQLYFQSSSQTIDAAQLTQKEQDLLSYMAKGLSIKDGAEKMKVSDCSAANYKKGFYRKLGISYRAEMASEVMRLGAFALKNTLVSA